MTIHGVSVFGSVCIMTDIVDIRRSRTRRHLVSYLRAAPRVDSSNERTHIGGINKRGRRLTFTLFLEASHHLVEATILERFVARSPGKSRKQVRVAVVGRTITTIFYMLKKSEASRFPRESSFRRKKRELERFKNFDLAA
jgi:transposase